MLDSAHGWQLREELRVGRTEDEGPDVFSDVQDTAVDDRGRLYVRWCGCGSCGRERWAGEVNR